MDAQSEIREWTDEYWDPDHTVALEDPLIFGKVHVQVRNVIGSEWEEEGSGEETDEYDVFIGKKNKSTTLIKFMKELLEFTKSLAEEGKVGGNIYHIKEASQGVVHLFMGD